MILLFLLALASPALGQDIEITEDTFYVSRYKEGDRVGQIRFASTAKGDTYTEAMNPDNPEWIRMHAEPGSRGEYERTRAEIDAAWKKSNCRDRALLAVIGKAFIPDRTADEVCNLMMSEKE
jgi:hypothetical protein